MQRNIETPTFQTRNNFTNNAILNSGVRTRSMVAENLRELFTPATIRNTMLNITGSVRRGLNQYDMFYNLIEHEGRENTAMIAKCSYYRPTKKSFDWLMKFKDTDNFGFGLVTAV